MPEYGGTVPKLIASHVGPLPKKSQKEGVWEDTRMLKFASGGCASKEGLGVQTMPKYDGTLPEVIASHVRALPLKDQKEGVWEDTRMLNSVSGDCASGVGLEGVNLA